jgi:hypothetical protein
MKTTCLLIASIALLASCKEQATQTTTSSREPGAALSAVLASPPKGEPKAIAAIRASAKPGDEITLNGRIMGNAKPFVDGRAVFILGDPDVLSACNENPGDNCETPWDCCCDSPEDKKRGTATIQIVGTDGRVLKEPVEGVGGLEKLAAATVTGKVAEGSSPDLLIVNATAIRTAAVK